MIEYLPEETKKELLKQLKENYNIDIKNFESKFFYTNKKEKVYLSDFDLLKLINGTKLKVVNLGIYIGKFHKSRFRLSIEGANLFLPEKNVLYLKEESLNSFLYGEDLEKEDFINFNNESNLKGEIKNNGEVSEKINNNNNNENNTYKGISSEINLNIFLPVKYKKYYLGSVLYNGKFFKNFISKGRKVEFNKIF